MPGETVSGRLQLSQASSRGTLTLSGSISIALSASCNARPYDSNLILACFQSQAAGRVRGFDRQ